ncbi:DUF6036 family nucleotidyltransferase [Hydrogenophaga sp. T2]|uniref:DUF6036 family nucleotidyltransferase n=1 Tax=Hydrogenophaga sp. T2 TaxID=3132823 RepID=UPI003CF993F7
MSRKLDLLFEALRRARDITGHTEFVVVGSLSALVHETRGPLPSAMTLSNDFDAYTRADPERMLDVVSALGEGSAFFAETGVFIDPVTPQLCTLPEGWEGRMHLLERDGVKVCFLDFADAAISKYARGEPNDLRWIRAGIEAGLLDLDVVVKRLRFTRFLDADEERSTRERVQRDLQRSNR